MSEMPATEDAPTVAELAAMIDHSLLNPTLTWGELESGCLLARRYEVASVCILPYAVSRCAELLAGSATLPSTTIGFPHGGQATSVKLAEVDQALDDGAIELDMVVNVSAAASGDWQRVEEEIDAIARATHAGRGKLKVIFENCYLKDEQKIRLCKICGAVGVDWVKTSTGYGSGGATDDDLRLMREHSPAHVQVKAAGGVRTLDRLLEVRALGVTRSGASKTAEILDEAKRRYEN